MASLYPSLEDMQVDKMVRSQQDAIIQQVQASLQNAYPRISAEGGAIDSYGNPMVSPSSAPAEVTLYPELADFMGLELSDEMIAANMPQYLRNKQVAVPTPTTLSTINNNNNNNNNYGMIAPLSGTSVGLQRAQITHGIRELTLCKDANKKVGLRAKSINKGVFVSVVVKNSPAALAGLRFGDQILQINGTVVAGYSMDDIHKLLKKSDKNNISIIVRDRPFERTITLHKDSTGHCGFQFNGNGKITTIILNSSAAKNGLLIDHYLLEINGQNVIGMKEKEIMALITSGGQIITVTVMPEYIYDHMIKKLSSSFIRSQMDHSIPDF